MRETEPRRHRFLSAYSATKAAAELEFAGTDAVILRPHAVYGPGDRTLLPRVIAAVRGRTLTLPEGAKVDHTLTHVDNVVRCGHPLDRTARRPRASTTSATPPTCRSTR